MISFIPDSGATTATAQNVNERTGQGIELEATYAINANWNASANYSYVKAKDDTLDESVGEYPSNQFYGRINWQPDNALRAYTQVTALGERERGPGDIRENLDGFVSIDIGGRYRFEKHSLDLELIINNALNEDIREPSTGQTDGVTMANIPNDLPQAGRSFYLRITKMF